MTLNTPEVMIISSLGLEVEQDNGEIRLHLDNYVKEMLEDYNTYIKRHFKPKKIPVQPGVVFTKDNAPETRDAKEQKIFRRKNSICCKLDQK
jgi:hypothetical protein